MSKFFVQVLLSLIVGAGAALGFNPAVKPELHETLREAKTSLHETTSVVMETANDLAAKIDVAISADANMESSAETEGTAESDSDERGSLLNGWLPALSLDHSFETETETDAKAETSGFGLELGGESDASLELGLGN